MKTNSKVDVVKVNGEILFSEKVPSGKTRVQLPVMKQGVFILQLKNSGFTEKKLIYILRIIQAMFLAETVDPVCSIYKIRHCFFKRKFFSASDKIFS